MCASHRQTEINQAGNIMNINTENEIFNKAAEYYDDFRPNYPQNIIDILINEAKLKSGSKILEIGAGSGKATEQISRNGFNIYCIEPGEDLVRKGNEKFKNDTVEFHKGRFEEADLPTEHFDVVFAAQSFHWIPQPQGFEKCANILKENGYLAILYNMYVTTNCEQDRELLALSDKHGGFADFVDESKCDERISGIVANIENSKRFSGVKVFKTSWVKDYTTEEYFGFVLTGNKILQKDENEKKIIYNDIVNLANKNNGIIRRPFLCVLYLAEKAN